MIKLLFSGLTLVVLVFQKGRSQTTSTPFPAIDTVKTFRDCPDCPEMIIIPAGKFMMGATKEEAGSFPEERPQREILIRSFAVGKFDITRGQWKAFVSETKRRDHGGCSWTALPLDSTLQPWDPNPRGSWQNLGFPQDDNHPAVCLTWGDVQDYIRWLSKKSGTAYRLLTESEWEYAARAGTSTIFYWGNSITHENANYGKDSCCGGIASGRDQWIYTSPVGAFPPNGFGLFDMSGNVMQYVEDCFSLYDASLPTDGSANKKDQTLKMSGDLSDMNGKNACYYRLVRGGDFGNPSSMMRPAYRNFTPGSGSTLENYCSSGLGFRVARSVQ